MKPADLNTIDVFGAAPYASMSPLHSTIHEQVTAFRAALDAADKSTLPFIFQAFPRGCCGALSDILSRYLQARLCLHSVLVSGRLPAPKGEVIMHAWLEVHGLVVDVTADQFRQPPVIVAHDSAWHRTFHDIDRMVLTYEVRWWSQYGRSIWRLLPGVSGSGFVR